MAPATVSPPRAAKKKTYSKNGCRECKRRKIKCDETKPQCLQCSRLRKICSYPGAGEKVLRVSKRYLAEHPEMAQKNGTASTAADLSPEAARPNAPEMLLHTRYHDVNASGPQYFKVNGDVHPNMNSVHPVFAPTGPYAQSLMTPKLPPQFISSAGVSHLDQYPPHMPHMMNGMPRADLAHDSLPLTSKSTLKPPYSLTESDQTPTPEVGSARNTSPMSKYSNAPQLATSHNSAVELMSYKAVSADTMINNLFNREDLNLLASDLNNLVGSIMIESNFSKQDDWDTSHADVSNNSGNAMASGTGLKALSSTMSGEMFPRNVPLSHIYLASEQERRYLKEFYDDFGHVILPFQPYDRTTQCYFNPARDIILSCAAKEPFLLAAILAQGARSSYLKNNSPDDEEAHCKYLCRCLKLLGPALDEKDSLKKDLTSNIGAVLLTVLLLTSANASASKQDWRPHLRGAKDLLLKYAMNKPYFRRSKILVWCKLWFLSFEVLAGLSSNRGGTLKTDEEMNLLISLTDPYDVEVLKEFGLLLDSGFNLLLGFHHDLIPTLRDLIKLLNKSRRKDYLSQGADVFEYLRLLSDFQRFSQVQIFNEKFVLTQNDFFNGIIPEGHLLDVQYTSNNEKVIINWMDTCQQAFVLASIIVILTKFLKIPNSNINVQAINYRLISTMSVLKVVVKPKFINSSLLMILWPMMICGMNSIDDDSKFIVKKFFRLSTSAAAGHFLRKMDRAWNKQRKGEPLDYSDPEDDTDTLTY